jgi:ribonuclease BN (tRNA processing enzyme)
VEITVLGKSPAMPDAGGASSGYLIREGDYTLLLDCGTGVFAQLREHCRPDEVDAVLITHMHADHMIDLLPYAHALGFVYKPQGDPPRLLMPPEAQPSLAQLGELFGIGYGVDQAFAAQQYDSEQVLELGPLTVRFQEVPHYIRAWACDLQVPDGRRFTFGADCAPNELLPRFARGTDLLMLEATEESVPDVARDDVRGHMTAREAGELARRAQARRVVLTHYSDLLNPETVRSEGEAGYGGPLELARAGVTFVI